MDDVTITLPVSNKEAVIRGYTTHADDDAAEQLMYDGVNAQTDEKGNQKFSLSMAKIMASKKVYVGRLVKTIDGLPVQKSSLGELHSKDYEAIKDAVDRIVEDNSPKAAEALKASTTGSTEK